MGAGQFFEANIYWAVVVREWQHHGKNDPLVPKPGVYPAGIFGLYATQELAESIAKDLSTGGRTPYQAEAYEVKFYRPGTITRYVMKWVLLAVGFLLAVGWYAADTFCKV